MNANAMKLDSSFIPVDVRQVMERYHQAGFDVWLVGGALRDHLMGTIPKDYDLATNADAQGTMQLFPRVVPVGLRHGTVQVHTELRDIEVTAVSGSSHEGILRDLGRRDFTVNAMALTYPGDVLLDPYEGQKDLRSRVLRAVGDARSRFREDPLRTLRAGRFLSVYGFRIEPSTVLALKEEAHGLRHVANERIRDEMFKMLLGSRVVEAFEEMRRGTVLQNTLPELLEGYGMQPGVRQGHDSYHHTLFTIRSCSARLRLRLAALFHDISRPRHTERIVGELEFPRHEEASARMAADIMSRWCMSNKGIKEVCAIIENQVPASAAAWTDAQVRRFISKFDSKLLVDVLELAHADGASMKDPEPSLNELEMLRSRIYSELGKRPPLRLEDLAVDGEVIMSTLKMRPGPLVGDILRRLHEEVLENPHMNESKTLINFLKKGYHAGSLEDPRGDENSNTKRRLENAGQKLDEQRGLDD